MDPQTSEKAKEEMDKVDQGYLVARSEECYELALKYRSMGLLDVSLAFKKQAISWRAAYLRANEMGWH